MMWKILTPEQWSAVGTAVSAIAAVLNIIVVVFVVIYTRSATRSAQAQAAVALRTLAELNDEKKRQRCASLMEAEARLKDLGQTLLVLEGAIVSIHFDAGQWKARPDDWHQVTNTVLAFWPDGTQKAVKLDNQLRDIDLNLQSLAHLPLSNESWRAGEEHLRESVHRTHPLAKEIWESIMAAAQN